MKFYDKLKKLMNHFKELNNWEITDTIIKAEDIVYGQYPDFAESYAPKGNYVCIRNFHFSCIYIREDQFEQFKNNKCVYCEEERLINLTHLLGWTIWEDCIAQVANKTVPPEANIKEIKICKLDNMYIYVTRVIKLKERDKLFEDLINFQIMKDKYHLK